MNVRPHGNDRGIRWPPSVATLAALAALLALLALAPDGLGAQVPTLPRVDSLIAAGDYAQARATLDRWWSAREEFDVPGSDRARALMLRARLADDIATAEPDYLAVVLGYPTSEYAPDALLRLGQGLLAAGQADRAAGYLQRLVADYPGRPEHTAGLLWLARAHTAARHAAAACSAAREGLRDASDPDLVAMLRLEESASCAVGSAVARAPGDAPAQTRDAPAARPPAARPAPAPERSAPPVASSAGQPAGRPTGQPADQPAGQPARQTPAQSSAAPAGPATGAFAAQTGAFRYPQGAGELTARLQSAGYRPRTVRVPGNDLLRVRVGRFATAAEAARLVAELKARGFDAYMVRDVREERAP